MVLVVRPKAADDVRATVGTAPDLHVCGAGGATGHRPCRAPGAPRLPRRRRRDPGAARRPAPSPCPRPCYAGWWTHHRAHRRRRHPAHRVPWTIPPAMAACCAQEGGQPVAIVEHRDATPRRARDHARSAPPSTASTSGDLLAGAGPGDARRTKQGEYYLTDVIGILRREGRRLEAMIAADAARVPRTSTTADQLAPARRRPPPSISWTRLMLEGVTVARPRLPPTWTTR